MQCNNCTFYLFDWNGINVLYIVNILLERKEQCQDSVTCWGDGTALREFLYVDDLAHLCVFLMNNYNEQDPVNAGSGEEISIKQLAELVAHVVGYKGTILWDTTKPNGTPRKLLDLSKSLDMGWKYKTPLIDGIKMTYEDFRGVI